MIRCLSDILIISSYSKHTDSFKLHYVPPSAVSFWSGVSVISVAALIAEVEDMQKSTVTTKT